MTSHITAGGHVVKLPSGIFLNFVYFQVFFKKFVLCYKILLSLD